MTMPPPLASSMTPHVNSVTAPRDVPAPKSTESEPSHHAAVVARRRPGHVLIIDDEPRWRELLSVAARRWDFSADTARSGEEALRLVDRHEPDIVVLDLNLPGIDGLETLAKLRAADCAAAAIVLTGFGDLQAARQAIRLDVIEFLTKPCPLGELELAFDRARKRASRAIEPVPAIPPAEGPPVPTSARLAEIERSHILNTLAKNQGNRTATALELGISRRTLQYRLAEYQEAGWEEA